jgi:hypothetical protein
MQVWIGKRVVQFEGADDIGLHATAEGAKELCEAHARQTTKYGSGSTIERWREVDAAVGDRHFEGDLDRNGPTDLYYIVRPIELDGVTDADQALTAAREDIRARRRHFASLGANEEYLSALDDAYGLVNNRIGEPVNPRCEHGIPLSDLCASAAARAEES